MPKSPRPTTIKKKARTVLQPRNLIDRSEFNRVVDVLNHHTELLEQIRQDLKVQFTRIAQLQAEVDRLGLPRTRSASKVR